MKNQASDAKESGSTTFLVKLETQYVNAGDFSINRLLVEMLSSYGQVRVNLFGAPDFFEDRWRECFATNEFVESKNEVTSDLAWGNFAGEQAKQTRCVAVMPAGGYPLSYNLRWVVRYLRFYSQFARFRRRNVEVLWAGSSFAIPRTKLRWFGLAALAKVQHLGVRDVGVVKQLQSFGIKQATYFPEWTLVGGKLIPSQGKGLSADKPRVVVISFRQERGEEAEELRDFVQALSKQCLVAKRELVVLNQVAGDDEFAVWLLNQSGTPSVAKVISGISGEMASRLLLRNADLVISNRLHVCLFAITEGTPAIAMTGLKYGDKIRGVIESTKLPCPLFPLHEWRKVLDAEGAAGIGGSEWLRSLNRAMVASAAAGESWMTARFGKPLRPLISSYEETDREKI